MGVVEGVVLEILSIMNKVRLPLEVCVCVDRGLDQLNGQPGSVEIHTNGFGKYKVRLIVDMQPKDEQRPGMKEY